jgi:hypothetical protein
MAWQPFFLSGPQPKRYEWEDDDDDDDENAYWKVNPEKTN